MSFVRLGLSSQSATVTNDEAAMGIISYHSAKVRIPKRKFMTIKTAPHIGDDAHFLLRLKNTISRKIPTAFGIIPACAPRQK